MSCRSSWVIVGRRPCTARSARGPKMYSKSWYPRLTITGQYTSVTSVFGLILLPSLMRQHLRVVIRRRNGAAPFATKAVRLSDCGRHPATLRTLQFAKNALQSAGIFCRISPRSEAIRSIRVLFGRRCSGYYRDCDYAAARNRIATRTKLVAVVIVKSPMLRLAQVGFGEVSQD